MPKTESNTWILKYFEIKWMILLEYLCLQKSSWKLSSLSLLGTSYSMHVNCNPGKPLNLKTKTSYRTAAVVKAGQIAADLILTVPET